MTSNPPIPHSPEGGLPDNVIPFRATRPEQLIDPSELLPAEAVNGFFVQFRHPAIRGLTPEAVARLINHQLSPDITDEELEGLSREELSWRQALLPLATDTSIMHDAQLAEFSHQDEIYATMATLDQLTQPDADTLYMQRQALHALMDFRVGTAANLQGSIAGSDQHWVHALRALFRNSRP